MTHGRPGTASFGVAAALKSSDLLSADRCVGPISFTAIAVCSDLSNRRVPTVSAAASELFLAARLDIAQVAFSCRRDVFSETCRQGACRAFSVSVECDAGHRPGERSDLREDFPLRQSIVKTNGSGSPLQHGNHEDTRALAKFEAGCRTAQGPSAAPRATGRTPDSGRTALP